jgi:hypothetical protein
VTEVCCPERSFLLETNKKWHCLCFLARISYYIFNCDLSWWAGKLCLITCWTCYYFDPFCRCPSGLCLKGSAPARRAASAVRTLDNLTIDTRGHCFAMLKMILSNSIYHSIIHRMIAFYHQCKDSINSSHCFTVSMSQRLWWGRCSFCRGPGTAMCDFTPKTCYSFYRVFVGFFKWTWLFDSLTLWLFVFSLQQHGISIFADCFCSVSGASQCGASLAKRSHPRAQGFLEHSLDNSTLGATRALCGVGARRRIWGKLHNNFGDQAMGCDGYGYPWYP